MNITPKPEASYAELVKKMSTHTQVTSKTPPTFLFHTDADGGVLPENSILFYLALKKAKVPAELHVYPVGGHGYGLRRSKNAVSTWPERAAAWLGTAGAIEAKK